MRRFEGFIRGINLGGWLSQADEKTHEHYRTFITEENIKEIASFGVDHIRVPVDYIVIEDEEGQMLPEGYEYIDKCVSWCEKYDLNMLIDMHNTYGYTFDPLDTEGDKVVFFHDEALQQRFYSMWDRISARYGNNKRIAFELLNEVISPDVVESWNKIADKAVEVIRKNAPETYVVIGGVRYNNVTSVPLLAPPKDDHVVYNFHCYEPMVFTHQRAFWVEGMPQNITVDYPDSTQKYAESSRDFDPDWAGAILKMKVKQMGAEYFEELFEPAVKAAEKNNAPLYCGEYGVIDQAPPEASLRWIKDIHDAFERYGIGRALWTYKEKDFGLSGEHYDSVRERIVKCL